MADIIYHNALALFATKAIDLPNDSCKVILLNSSYTPNADHTVYTDVSTYELSTANGYTQKTKTTAFTVTDVDGSDNVKVDCADVSWTASGGDIGPARYAAIIDDTATDDPLIYLFDFGTTKTAGNGTDFKITIDAAGLFTMAQA